MSVLIHVVPDPEMTTVNTGNRTLQLTLLYDKRYNVSITQPGICGQPNQTSIHRIEVFAQYVLLLL